MAVRYPDRRQQRAQMAADAQIMAARIMADAKMYVADATAQAQKSIAALQRKSDDSYLNALNHPQFVRDKAMKELEHSSEVSKLEKMIGGKLDLQKLMNQGEVAKVRTLGEEQRYTDYEQDRMGQNSFRNTALSMAGAPEPPSAPALVDAVESYYQDAMPVQQRQRAATPTYGADYGTEGDTPLSRSLKKYRDENESTAPLMGYY